MRGCLVNLQYALAANPKLFSFIHKFTSNSIPALRSFYIFFQTIIDIGRQRSWKAILSVKIGLQSMGYIKKSERSKRSKGYGVKAISRGSWFFFPSSAS